MQLIRPCNLLLFLLLSIFSLSILSEELNSSNSSKTSVFKLIEELDALKKDANKGFADAQVNLGYIYDQDYEMYGIERDTEKALKLYISAAEKYDPQGQFNLAHIYSESYEEFGIERDTKKALKLYSSAAEQGHIDAIINLALISEQEYEEYGIEHNPKKALSLYISAADLGDIDSQYNLALIYDQDYEEFGIDRDTNKALKLYASAAEQGNIDSQYNLAVIYDQDYEEFGIERDTNKALKLYATAAEQGNENAQNNLAVIYDVDYEAYGIQRNTEKALSLYISAADLGDIDSQYNLALIYDQDYEEFGIDRDTNKALKLYTSAAEQGVVEAQHYLGLIYDNRYEEFNVEMDLELAVGWYQKASNQGYALSKNNLGIIYWYGGRGVPRNKLIGRNYFIEASKLGSELALKNLAISLSESPEHDSESRDLVLLKNETGDADNSPMDLWMTDKLLNPGSMYFNPDKAIKTLNKISLSDEIRDEFKVEAALKLSSLYSKGRYVEKNLNKAKNLIINSKLDGIDSKPYGSALTDYLINNEGFTFNKEIKSLLDNYCLLGARTEYFEDFVLQELFQNHKLENFRNEFIPTCFEIFVKKEITDGHFQSAGQTYFQGFMPYVEPNFEKAVKLWKKSLEQDASDYESMFNLGFMYSNGLGVKKDVQKAKKLILQAKDFDYGPAYNFIGEAREAGSLGFQKNIKKALEYFTKAQLLDPNDPLAITNMARFYLNEKILERDAIRALTLLDKAYNEMNHLGAGLELAKYFLNTEHIPNHQEKALLILDQVKQGGNRYYLLVGPEKYHNTLDEAVALANKTKLSLKAKLMPSLGDYYALIIGNSNYSNLQPLKTAKNDAKKIASELEANYGFKTEILLDASRNQLLGALNQYRKKLKPDDNFLLYYAGHGMIDETNEGYWQPIDAELDDDSQWISNSRINRTLQKFKSRNLLLISDSCFSGSQLRGVKVSDSSALLKNTDENAIIASKYNASISRVALSSGGLSPVPDSIGFSENSLFAESLINALKTSDGIFFAEDLYKKVRDRVIPMAARSGIDQSPDYGQLFSAGHSDGDFIFQRMALQN